ncbi:kelch-like protein 24a [Branchiostoma lanceolatum]|uniref:kelch-like protein 24a n=1 Tax=Branchiostoma lanceolatum TaxID=7740 RepID=UPI0034512716
MDDNHSEDNSETADNSLECDDSGWYPAQLLQRLQEFRTEGHLFDVTLFTEEKEIPCHRLVLSACSDYFHAMFRGGHSESKKDKIEIGGVSAEALQLLVDYAYTARVTINSNNIQPLYEAANMFQVKLVEELCEDFLTDNLSPESCLGTWALADKVLRKRLSDRAKLYALKQFEEVCLTEEFLELPVDFLKTYIADDGLRAKKEERVLEMIMLWVRHDLKERQSHLKDLLECVCFSHVDQDYLKDIMETDKVLAGVSGIKELIKDQSRHTGPRHIQQEEVLVIGGNTISEERRDDHIDSCSIYTLDLNCDCVDLYPLPESLVTSCSYAACVVNNDVVVTGGVSNESKAWAWQYKPSLNSWTQLGSLKKDRFSHGMTVLHGKVYVVGGITLPSYIPLPDVEVYSEMTDSWKQVAPLQEGVRDFGIASCCEKVFVFGGKTGKCTLWPFDNSHNTDAVQCYDPAQNVWTFAAPLPNPVDNIIACTVNSKIYLVGGELAHVLCYDPQKDCYEKMTDRLVPWCDCGATVCGSEIYITGGCDRRPSLIEPDDIDDEVPLATVQCYNVTSDTMIMMKELPVPIWDHISDKYQNHKLVNRVLPDVTDMLQW